MVEMKRKFEEDLQANEALEEYKKRAQREIEQLAQQVEEARANAERVDKSRKKFQAEVTNNS
jgi:hypothetical protein